MEKPRKLCYNLSIKLKQLLASEGRIDSILQQYSTHFSNAQKVRKSYEMLKEKDLLPRYTMHKEKNENKAWQARAKGNEFFKNSEFVRALESYNESLCFAPPCSESMAIGYANRSAIYFKTGFYKICMENIELALENPYPEKLKPKLLERRKKCEALIESGAEDSMDSNKPQSSLELSYSANKNNSTLIDCLELNENAECGREIVTTKDLKPGDVIMVEKSFLYIPEEDTLYGHCYNCGLFNFYNLKPCPKSTIVMFCSPQCAEEAWNRYYKFECPIINGLFRVFDETFRAGFRSTLKAFTMFDNPKDFKKFMKSIEPKTAFDLATDADEPSKFSALHSLMTNENQRGEMLLFEYTALGAMAWHMFKKYTDLKYIFKDKELEDIFLELIMKLFQIAQINGYPRSDVLSEKIDAGPDEEKYQPKIHGVALGLFQSLINHSCAPNVQQFQANGVMNFVAIRPIKAGHPILISYNTIFHHWVSEREKRQCGLEYVYQFNCKCEACTENYAVRDQAPFKNLTSVIELFEENLDLVDDFDFNKNLRAAVNEQKDRYHEVLRENEQHYPCMEICGIHRFVLQFYSIILMQKPLELIFVASND